MQGIRKISAYWLVITRVVLLYYLAFLLWRGYSHLLPPQLESPTLFKLHYDLFFWLYKMLGMDKLLVYNNTGSFIFTILLFTFCIGALLVPRKKYFAVPFSLFFLLYATTFNIFLCHSAHYLGGMVWLSVAFWPSKDENFDMLWEAMRYYACWVYGSAFLWKVAMGAFFQWDAGMLTFKGNLAEYLYQNPSNTMSDFYYFFLQHPVLLDIGHKFVFLAEGVFLVGFFTKKYDKLLILSAFIIFLSIYTFSDVFFAELLIIVFPLLPEGAWRWIEARAPFLNKP